MSTQAPAATPPPVGLGPIGWTRWVWRQLTSMRTALLLLLLLAVGAVPGSVIPQTGIDPVRVARYKAAHTALAPWLERVGGFDVYGSPWFAAIYLLLFASLVGCVLPRTRVHLRNLREAPPRTPADLSRLPEHRTAAVQAAPEQVLTVARTVLRRRRYRIGDHPGSLAAQRGELRETGNLVFHLALIGVLISFAVSSLWGYRVQTIVPVGQAFVDSATDYDTFDPGALVNADDLPPFRFVLRAVDVAFDASSVGNQFGAPRSFAAVVDLFTHPGAAGRREVIKVNHPLRVAGAAVYLAGNGYAPVISVTDPSGHTTTQQVPFLVDDANYTSHGVVKVTDSSPQQIGLKAIFTPTTGFTAQGVPVSTFPDARKPRLIFNAYVGDLGVDSGVPQNVYDLDTTHMKQLRGAGGTPFSASLAPGQSVQLPGGAGTVTFDRLTRYAGLTVRHDPGRTGALVFALSAIAGLTVSLFVPRRRLWVRARQSDDGSGTIVEVGALARSEDHGLAAEADAVLTAVLSALAGGSHAPPGPEPHDRERSPEPLDHPAGGAR